MQVAAGLPITAGECPHGPSLNTSGDLERRPLSAARLRGLLAACESLGPPEAASVGRRPGRDLHDAHALPAVPLDVLAACERCRARGAHAALLALLEADVLRELAAGKCGNGAEHPNTVSEPGRHRACLGSGYRGALELDASLPGGARARVAVLNALRGVMLGTRPRAGLLMSAALHDLGPEVNGVELGWHGQRLGPLDPGPPDAKAESAGHEDDNLGVGEYLLRMLGRLGMPDAKTGAGGAPAPAVHEQARDLAAWLEAAAGLGAGAAPSYEQPRDRGLPSNVEPAMRPALGGEGSRLGIFLAHLRAADAALPPDRGPARYVLSEQQAEQPAASNGAGAPAGGRGVKAEPSSAAAEPRALGKAACKAEPVLDMDSQRDAAGASGAAAACEWAGAARRALAVHLACTSMTHYPGTCLAGDSAPRFFASARKAGGCGHDVGLSDRVFGGWLCCNGGSDATGADGPAGSRKRKRGADADEGAPVPAAPSAAAAAGPDATGDAGQAADGQDAGARSPPCELADAVARHGLPSPALLARALAQLLDARAWERVASLERAAAARADPSPASDPDLSPGLPDDAACGAAKGAGAGASAAGGKHGGSAAGSAGRCVAADDGACRQLLRCGAALAAFLGGLLDAPSSAVRARTARLALMLSATFDERLHACNECVP